MTRSSNISQAQKKQFRSIGHSLKPIVTIGGQGLSENLGKELERALEDHELIKVKLPAGDRQMKLALIKQMCEQHQCQNVQQIGNIVLVYRAAKKANPKLSNLLKQGSAG